MEDKRHEKKTDEQSEIRRSSGLLCCEPADTSENGGAVIFDPNESEMLKHQSEAIATAVRVEGCVCGGYRYYQHKAEGNAKRKKYYDWLNNDGLNEKGRRPKLKSDIDSWISAAVFGRRYNRFLGIEAVRKETSYAEWVNCNFVILKWEKSELDFTPTLEQGKELVLSVCRKYGLPDPRITYVADGLEVKWYWQDSMRKENACENSFNSDWNKMQRELYEKFRYLGAEENGITTVFRLPGSLNTTKKLKTTDRVVRDVHEGKVLSSYCVMQRILGLPVTSSRREKSVEILREETEALRSTNIGLVNDWKRELFRIHPPTGKNWVCVGAIKNGWKQHFERACDLPLYLMKLAGTPEFSQLDIYVSQGEFQSSNDRHVSNLASIRVNFVDLDYKLLRKCRPGLTENPTAEEWKELVVDHCMKHSIPAPNAIVFSGGGVHLKWIYGEAVTRNELDCWSYVQRLLLEQFRTLGADSAAVDAARVLRLVGTQNQKTSEIVRDRKVRVISSESFAERPTTLERLIEGLETSKPERPDEFNAIVADWKKRPRVKLEGETGIIRLNSDKKSLVVPSVIKEAWKKTILRRGMGKRTYIRVKIGDGEEQFIETSQLKEVLRGLYGTPDVKLSLSESASPKKNISPAYIPSNYILLSNCPGETFEAQKENIFRRCREYRDIGMPNPNQIIRVGNTLLAEWKYTSRLPGYALSRWLVTQEFICRWFEDWGAMESADNLTATALLPVSGFDYEDGTTATLEYSTSKKEYTFDRLAEAVLNFSQEEVRKYEEQKQKEKAERAALRKLSKELVSLRTKGQGKFALMAHKRLMDLVKLLELRKDENGEVPQGTRELCVFWMLVFARQAGLITTYEEFKAKAQDFIGICGEQFKGECFVETVKSAYRKTYCAKTATLIGKLQITPEEQLQMTVLKVSKVGRPRQKRSEWLSEHVQESSKPWEALGISRATYFRWKKAGKLPVGVQHVYEPSLQDEKMNETGTHYIMRAAQRPLVKIYIYGSCGRVWGGGVVLGGCL